MTRTLVLQMGLAVTSFLFMCFPWSAYGQRADNQLANGDFEQGLDGWNDFWSRTGEGEASVVDRGARQGNRCIRIRHEGHRDWALNRRKSMEVKPGEIYEMSVWIRGEGEGSVTLGATLYGEQQRVLDWAFGGRTVPAHSPWRQVRTRFVIPETGRVMTPRIIGSGPAEVWLDDVQLVRAGSLDEWRRGDLPPKVGLQNGGTRWTLDTADGSWEFRAFPDGPTWQSQRLPAQTPLVVLDAEISDKSAALQVLEPVSALEMSLRFELDGTELLVTLQGQGGLSGAIDYPYPVRTQAGDWLICPVNEGIGYPVDDSSLPTMSYHMYGGHGLCMGWYGIMRGKGGLMMVVETPDDAMVRIPRRDELLCLAPRWIGQKNEFGYARRIRYVDNRNGGYVAMCKRYRDQARREGRLVTLAEKRKRNPFVDQLIGAVNIWCWERDPVAMCRELQARGIERILWSRRSEPETIAALNEMGILTSRYDIYQDAMNPANFPQLRGRHPDWTSEAWPDDLAIDANGQWIRGWRVRGKDGTWYPCGVLCDRQAVEYARRRISQELPTHPYHCRFIDTTTASPWRECYHPDHPMTRSDSRHWKMELLRLVSEHFNLVTGSETGHEAAVPYVHYFEGMMSLGPYRIPDAGRAMQQIIDDPPERVVKFQTGHYYRLPLWELVYHDCVVAQWYWGDYNNKMPSLWDRRDLWNALYGTPPMFMFNRQIWNEYRDRFVQSYETATPVARATGYVEMVSHEWLTDDHSVQRTRFANGVEVTVNFGDQPFSLPNGRKLAPLGCDVRGVPGN